MRCMRSDCAFVCTGAICRAARILFCRGTGQCSSSRGASGTDMKAVVDQRSQRATASTGLGKSNATERGTPCYVKHCVSRDGKCTASGNVRREKPSPYEDVSRHCSAKLSNQPRGCKRDVNHPSVKVGGPSDETEFMPTFVDIFAGAGLFSGGFASAGFRPLLAVDIDPLAIETYRRNLGPFAVHASVERVQEGVRADVLTAGPPCQGFSSLGTRDPADQRNRLCLAIAKWAAATNASIVVVENVPPFLKSPQWQRMASALKNLGYAIDAWCLNAADFGTPQYRIRSFTVASKIGMPTQPKPLPRVAAEAAFCPIRRRDPMHIWPQPSPMAAARICRIPQCGDRRDIMSVAPELCPPSWFDLGCQVTDVWGRIDPNRPANTLKSRFQNPSTGRYLHPTDDRVISLREGARLQGVPDDWVFAGHREAMVRQIGNGVPLPLGRAVAIEIARLFESTRAGGRWVA